MKRDKDDMTASILFRLTEERIQRETLTELLIKKGVINESELEDLYNEKFESKKEEYAAESLNLTLEEYKKMNENK